MTSWSAWLVVAGAGALHGANPVAGWILAADWGMRSGDRRQALLALVPIAVGHGASVAIVAAAVALGFWTAQWIHPAAGVVVAIFLAVLCAGVGCRSKRAAAFDSPRAPGRIWTALCSFVVSTAHGSGMMLVPALVPLCLGNSPAREITASGSLPLALTAVAVHAVAMLGTQALVAVGAVRGVDRLRRWWAHQRANDRRNPSGSAVSSCHGYAVWQRPRDRATWNRAQRSRAQ